jgi:hypothetical protein
MLSSSYGNHGPQEQSHVLHPPNHNNAMYQPNGLELSVDQLQVQNFGWDVLLTEAIQQIPVHEKTGYLNALTKCPSDVRTNEADPAVFVEYEDSNMWAAARRLVNYWEWRVLLFGETMAYKSILNFVSNEPDVAIDSCYDIGDMPSSDVNSSGMDDMLDVFRRMVQDQGVVVLPHKDLEGNYIILTDETRFHLGWDTENDAVKGLRVLFYNFTLLINKISNSCRHQYPPSPLALVAADDSTDNATQSRKMAAGFVAISIISIGNELKIRKTTATNLRDLLHDAMPARLVRFHVLFVPKDST